VAARFDPDGDYVRRHVPELAAIAGSAVHRPWALPAAARRRLHYPPPLTDPARPTGHFARAARTAAAGNGTGTGGDRGQGRGRRTRR
jgi:deoxyribodipyrimidine photo-lyase